MAESKSSDLQALVAEAKRNPRLRAQMLADLNSVIRENNLVIDGESDEYKELALRIYHANLLINKSLDELEGKFGRPGMLPQGLGSPQAGYERLVRPEDLRAVSPNPDAMRTLKDSILNELRQELNLKNKK